MNSKQNLIHIDSAKRYRGTSTNFQIRFTYPTPIQRRLKIVNLEFPNTMYPINQTNNTIIWTDSSSTVRTTTIPVGVYVNNGSYATAIATAMSSTAGVSDVITGSFVDETYAVSLTSDTAPFQILTSNVNFTAHIPLGFNSTDKTGLLAYVSDFPIDKSGVNNVFFHTDIKTNSYTTDGLRDILFKLPIDVNFGSIVYYPKFAHEWITLPTSTYLNDFSVVIKDKEGNIIDLNNFDWQMTLVVE